MKKERIKNRMAELARVLGYDYKCLRHLATAMYCKKEAGRKNYTNDAMATLGDAVLKLIFSEHFYNMGLDKDEITDRKMEIESNATLRKINDAVGIYRFAYNDAYFADEAPASKRLPHPKHDIYVEAIIAAVYKDRGLAYTRQWVLDFWKRHTDISL